jgi:type 2 lantibiotic biosynthesis protein LanM
MITPVEAISPFEAAVPPGPAQRPDSKGGSGIARCLVSVSPAIQKAKALVQQGAEALGRSHAYLPFDLGTIADTLSAPLAPQLLMILSRTLILELNIARLEGRLTGNTPEERFESFIERLQDSNDAARVLSEYPVLTDQLNNRLEKWASFSLEFLRDLCDDWTSLRQLSGRAIGQLSSIDAGAGDTHREGRSVMIVTFADHFKLVYKPRSLAIDEHFQSLLVWLNERGARPAFPTTRVLNRGRHGWSEFITAADCRSEGEISRFYERQGGYLAVLYALNATDFHYENLIAAGENPALIDVEALFHPRTANAFGNPDPGFAALAQSVLAVGLLPMRFWVSEEYSGIDLSGLSNPAGQLSPRAVPTWNKVDTDEMHMVRRRTEMSGGHNCPKLNGTEVKAFDYVEHILAGFYSTYELLLRRRSEFRDLLACFAGDEVRFIARPTRTYATLLFESFHPDLLRDNGGRRALFERLREGSAQSPVLDRLLSSECNDLDRGDIPIFTTRPFSRHLWNSDGECMENFFSETPIALVSDRLDALSKKDLERQAWTVRASIATLSPDWSGANRRQARAAGEPSGEAGVSFKELILAACAVGDRIEQLALPGGNGTNWIGLASLDERRRQLSPLGFDLYDGLPGVILFLAYLAKISGNARYRDLAESAMVTFQRQIDSHRAGWGGIGGFAGWGSVIYVLSHLSIVLDNPSLAATAENLVESLADRIRQDRALDVIGGAAGCVLALRSLEQVKPSTGIIEAARSCGDHLVQTSQPVGKGLGWPSLAAVKSPLTGFAHGSAGIAYALFTVAHLTKEPRFDNAARAAIEYERGLFSPVQRNWPDFRSSSNGGFATYWCHGAPGIGLSRLCSLRFFDEPLLREEIYIALATTLSAGFGGSHIACHGDLGNTDILLYAGETLGEPRWRERAKQQTARVLSSARDGGWVLDNPLNVETPGFMTGLAGIGYTFLRLADPSGVPCVLALAPPQVQR